MNITPLKDAGNLVGGFSSNLAAQPVEKTSAVSGDSKSFQAVWTNQTGKNASGANAPVKGADAAQKKADGKPESRPANAGKPKDAAADSDPASKEAGAPQEVQEAKDAGSAEPQDAVPGKATGKPLTDEELAAAEEVLGAFAMQLFGQITDTLELSPEDADALLAELDLGTTDLLEPQSLNEFLFAAMGVEDQVELLTSEEQFTDFKELTGALQELLDADSGIGELSVGQLAGKADEAAEALPEQEPQLAEPAEPVRVPELRAEREERPAEPERREVPAGGEGDEETDLRAAETSDGQTLGMRSLLRGNRRGEEEAGNQGEAGAQGAQQLRMPEVPAEQAAEASYSSRTEEAQEIADQILGQIRTQIRPDSSSIEMQLHPASLGTLRVNISNAGGNVTASFIAQNEQVKAAIEGQMVQLREQFEAQGIKVEAVEVTVESHAFEQNLEQNAQSEQNASQNEPRPRRTRRLDLSGLGEDGLDGIEGMDGLSEADRIAAEMMQASGNTVDYTA